MLAATGREYWKVAELAQRWSLTKMAIGRLINAGQLDAINVSASQGRATWRVPHSEVVRFERTRSTAIQAVPVVAPRRPKTSGRKYV